MYIEEVGKACTGCMACKSACRTDAIRMIPDEEGFPYPKVLADKCKDCGLCTRVCPMLNTEERQMLKKLFCGRAKDKETVRKSSSGGVFTALAEKVLAKGGVVFGAAYEKDPWSVSYKSTEEVSLDALRRSKYVEAHVGDSFHKVKVALEAGKQVLFVGTPCHVTGLKLFLTKDYPNLLTVDFICGGGASPRYFQEHLATLEKKYGGKVTDVNFRPKLYGWKEYALKIDFDNKKTYKAYAYLDTYFRGFLHEGTIKRETCFSCRFRKNHAADIILGDFWGHGAAGIKTDNEGLSLLITNSEKGEVALLEIAPFMELCEIAPKDVAYAFEPYKKAQEKIEKKKAFSEAYKKWGFEKAAKKLYMKKCMIFKLKKRIKGLLK
ncbi:MAG: Coenzyme F420 hydrogenase/dehydrogenase, beta subunit C-terminal domain [Clostridia bacterium]|nr:Coenzyme F420 hydrogenase/dehydrogenase, beta subunit C-terminal domain [Clostridia bacterium]